MTESKAQAVKFANNGADIVRENINDAVISIEVLRGTPEREIVETAKKFHPELIVVGSHGRGFRGRLTLGSVSDAIIHHAPCSVLVSRTNGDK